jgi:hypothetical protein
MLALLEQGDRPAAARLLTEHLAQAGAVKVRQLRTVASPRSGEGWHGSAHDPSSFPPENRR